METVIAFTLGIVIAVIIFFFLRNTFLKNSEKHSEDAAKLLEMQLSSLLPELMQKSSEQLVMLANEKLGSEKKEIKTDMESKRSEIERMVKQIQQELRESQRVLNEAEQKRIDSFGVLRERIESHAQVTEQLKVSTEELKNVLSSNQTRGQFGERVAVDLLKIAGFVSGVDFIENKKQEGSQTRPDFTIFLPGGKRINVDAKFPFANLQKMAGSDSPEEKKRYAKAFEQDIKAKVKEVSSRDYINVNDNTVDFVILFIPNEMIFSYIYEHLNEVWQEAMGKSVILAGPFSFTAILRMVRQAHDNFMYEKNVRKMVVEIKNFEKAFIQYNEEFKKIGVRIESLKDQYEKVDGTRTRALFKSIDKVRLENSSAQEDELNLLEDKSSASSLLQD